MGLKSTLSSSCLAKSRTHKGMNCSKQRLLSPTRATLLLFRKQSGEFSGTETKFLPFLKSYRSPGFSPQSHAQHNAQRNQPKSHVGHSSPDWDYFSGRLDPCLFSSPSFHVKNTSKKYFLIYFLQYEFMFPQNPKDKKPSWGFVWFCRDICRSSRSQLTSLKRHKLPRSREDQLNLVNLQILTTSALFTLMNPTLKRCLLEHAWAKNNEFIWPRPGRIRENTK